jgi:hypothetical protein
MQRSAKRGLAADYSGSFSSAAGGQAGIGGGVASADATRSQPETVPALFAFLKWYDLAMQCSGEQYVLARMSAGSPLHEMQEATEPVLNTAHPIRIDPSLRFGAIDLAHPMAWAASFRSLFSKRFGLPAFELLQLVEHCSSNSQSAVF